MVTVNKRLEELEKANETLTNELKNKSGQSNNDQGDFESLLNKINSLESSLSTLSQSYDSLKADTSQNRSDIEGLNVELFGDNVTSKDKHIIHDRKGNSLGIRNIDSSNKESGSRDESTLKGNGYSGKDSGKDKGNKAEESIKGRIPNIEAQLNGLNK